MAKLTRGQRAEVLKHLNEKGSITSMEAFQLFGATRLSAIIFDLRKLGYPIETYDVVGKTRYGDTCVYAKYVLNRETE